MHRSFHGLGHHSVSTCLLDGAKLITIMASRTLYHSTCQETFHTRKLLQYPTRRAFAHLFLLASIQSWKGMVAHTSAPSPHRRVAPHRHNPRHFRYGAASRFLPVRYFVIELNAYTPRDKHPVRRKSHASTTALPRSSVLTRGWPVLFHRKDGSREAVKPAERPPGIHMGLRKYGVRRGSLGTGGVLLFDGALGG